MALATYTDLKAQVAAFLNRTDLTAQIPVFVQLAEAEMARDLFLEGTLIEKTSTITTERATLPTDLKQLVNIRVDAAGKGPMVRVEPHVMDGLRVEAATDIPRYYTVTGTQVSFYPAPPSTGVVIHITYYAALPSLSDSQPTNAVLTSWPDLYLYGSLKHTAPYLRDDERVALWDALYQKAKEQLIIANERAEFGATPLAILPRRAFGSGKTRTGVILVRNP